MKSILFIHSSSEMYGSDRSLLNIVKNINKLKYKIFVMLPCEGPLVKQMEIVEGVTVVIYPVAVLRRKNLSLTGGIEYIKNLHSSVNFIKQFIKNNNIEIVDTNTSVIFPGAIAAKKCKAKSVWHVREIIKSPVENNIISFMLNVFSDRVIVNSRSTGNNLAVKKDKIRVVYNAVEEYEDSQGKEHTNLCVGMAGRINRWKGQSLFVDVAEIVHKKYPEVLFEIAGEPYSGEDKFKDDLRSYISQKGLEDTVLLLGQVNDMPEFYRNLDIFVLPSTQPEPFGLVLIEAMEFELPVTATNHGGPTEIIENGATGYLVDWNTSDEMAQRIMELLSDDKLRKMIGSNAKKSKRSKFSVNKMVGSIENIFDGL